MKRSVTLIIFLLSLLNLPLSAQCPPPGFPSPGDTCPEAPILCTDLDGYCATINENDVPQGFPGCPGNALNNDEWFAFYAGTTTITIEIAPSNCQAEAPNPMGLQAAVYQGCGGPVMDTQCGCTTGTIVLNSTNFIVGEIYWIVVDGCAGDVCDYEVSVTQGSTVGNQPDDPGLIDGEQNVCVGDAEAYSVPPVAGATIYNWTISPPIGTISGMGNSITVDWALAGTAQLCLEVANACFANPNQVCYTVDINENPTANALPPPPVTCTTSEVQINGSGSTTGPNISYQWTTLDGNIVSGDDTLMPTVDSDGTYTLTVTNTATGCTAEQMVTVMEDTALPTADAGPDLELSCVVPQTPLFGFGSSFGPPGFTYQWTTVDGNIVSGATTQSPTVDAPGTYTITVVNVANGCVSTDEVVVTADDDTPIADAGPDLFITCTNNQVTIDGSGSTSGPNISYAWSSTDGNIVSGGTTSSPVVDQSGTYELLVINTSNGCTDTSSVFVDEDLILPSVIIQPPQEISCANPVVSINGSNSSSGDFTYSWTTPDGNIVSGQDATIADVDLAGTYTLTVTNNTTGCSNQETVLVTGDVILPNIVIDPPAGISCNAPEITLDATGSDSGPNITYSWTTPDGNIVNGDDTSMPTVGSGGTYELTITNTDTNCSSTETVTVTENADQPQISIDPVSELNCTLTELTINANVTSGPNVTISWNTPDGNIVNGDDTYTPLVDAAGTYTLTVTDNDSGCDDVSSVTVDQDAIIPQSDAGPDGTLTCSVTDIDLDGTNSDGGPNITYTWTTPDGNIVNGGDTNQPLVDAPGTYILETVNTDNTCLSTDTVVISEDVSIISSQIEPPILMGCADPTITLDGSASSAGPNITYTWTTPDGNIIGGGDTPEAEIDQPGNYTLLVYNVANDCFDSTQTTVIQDLTDPIVDAGPDGSITCTETTVELQATSAGNTGNFTYQWTTPDGNIASGSTTLDPVVDAAGTYTLTVTDTINQCTATSSTDVVQDADVPITMIDPSNPFNCTFTSVTLDGSGSSQGTDLVYTWTTADGNIVNNPDEFTAVVDQAGSYTLTIQDTVNLCISSSTLEIMPDTLAPAPAITDPALLTCTTTSLTLDSEAGGLPNVTISWNTPNGNIVADGNTFTPTVDQPGTYELTVTNDDNGCTATESTLVDADVDLPTVDAGATATITCDDPTLTLQGTGDAGGPTVTYDWTTPDGNILSGADTPSPVVDAAGIYTLTVLNTENGCADAADVTIDIDQVAPVADPGQPGLLNCYNPEIQLDGTASSAGPEFTYEWTTTDGNIISDATTTNPTVDATGTYNLTVTDTDNGCVTENTISVTEDFQEPTVDAGAAATLNCTVTATQLDGTASSAGPEFTYEWTTTDGNIINGATTLTPEIDAPGTYQLEVFNQDNGCNAFSEVDVVLDADFPIVAAAADDPITCDVTSVQLDGTGTDTGSEFQYQWNTADGNIVSGGTTLIPSVDLPGTYTLTVTNQDNDCVSTTDVTVAIDTIAPLAEAGQPATLTCEVLNLDLDATGSSAGVDFAYQWSTADGNIVSGGTSLNPQIDQPGTYEILVTNQDNGCESTDLVSIDQDIVEPTAVTDAPDILTCTITDVNITGAGSSTGPEFSYTWSTGNGNIVSGGTSLDPLVDQPGQYTLTILDADNGCSSESTVTVDEDVAAPLLSIADPDILTCVTEVVMVDADGSSSGPEFVPSWSTSDGNIISGANSLTIDVDQPGTYTLLIENTDNGCTTEEEITVAEDVALPVVDAGMDFLLPCLEDITTLDGSATAGSNNLQIEWTTIDGQIDNGNTSLKPAISTSGTYTLTVTNLDNGCTSTDEVVVTEDNPEDPNVNSQNPLCNDALGTIEVTDVNGGTPPYSYSIDNGETYFTNPFFTNVDEGAYSIIVQDALGCESGVVEAFIDIPEAIQIFTETTVEILQGNESQIDVQLNVPGSTVQQVIWTPTEGLSCTDCLNPIASPLSTTIYELEVIVEGDCRSLETVEVVVDERPAIYAPNIFRPDGDGVNDKFYLFGRLENIAQINNFVVFDRWGETVWSYTNFQPNDPASGWDGTLRGQPMNAGVFVWFAEVEMIDGRIEFFEGDITLVR